MVNGETALSARIRPIRGFFIRLIRVIPCNLAAVPFL